MVEEKEKHCIIMLSNLALVFIFKIWSGFYTKTVACVFLDIRWRLFWIFELLICPPASK